MKAGDVYHRIRSVLVRDKVLSDCLRLFFLEARDAKRRGDLGYFTYYRACALHLAGRKS